MGTRKKNATLLLSSYIILVVISMIMPNDISRYNGYFIVAFGLLLILYERNVTIYVVSGLVSILMALVSLSHGVKWLYVIGDTALFFYIFSSVNLIEHLKFGKLGTRILKVMAIIMATISVVGSVNPGSYELSDGELRYNGVFVSGNTSACMFLIVLILIWEMLKETRFKKTSLIALIALFFVYFLASQTRTMLFAIPYWFYQFYKIVGKKATTFLALVSIPFVGLVVAYFIEHARLTEDYSMITRAGIYELQISGIMDNYVIIPHGSEKSIRLVRHAVGDDNFSPHNDFLSYTYNWGVFFILILLFVYLKLRKLRLFDLNLAFMLLAYAGFALHNLLFLPYVWFPLIFLLIYQNQRLSINNYRYENANIGKKVQ